MTPTDPLGKTPTSARADASSSLRGANAPKADGATAPSGPTPSTACPKCGFAQQPANTCRACGVDMAEFASRWHPTAAHRRDRHKGGEPTDHPQGGARVAEDVAAGATNERRAPRGSWLRLPAAITSDAAESLAVLLETGLEPLDATTLLAQSAPGRAQRELFRLADGLARGECLSAAMARVPAMFSRDDVASVARAEACAEATSVTLRSIGERLAHRAEAWEQGKRGLIFPAFVVVSYLLLAPASLLITDSTAAFAAAAANNLAWLLVALAGGACAFTAVVRHRGLRRALETAAWWLPRLASPWVHHRRATYCSALAHALDGGQTTTPRALEAAALISGDIAPQQRMGSLAPNDAGDLGLAGTLAQHGLVHPNDRLIVAAADRAKTLPDALRVLAGRSARRRRRAIRTATTLLGAALTMAVLGQAAMGVMDAYQSLSLGTAGALPDLDQFELPLSDVPMVEMP